MKNLPYYKVTEITGGYDRLDQDCQFLDSEVLFGIYGITDEDYEYWYQETYNTGKVDFWAYPINDVEYVSPFGVGSTEVNPASIGIQYSYPVSHGNNVSKLCGKCI